jgi:hypothetical protein
MTSKYFSPVFIKYPDAVGLIRMPSAGRLISMAGAFGCKGVLGRRQ